MQAGKSSAKELLSTIRAVSAKSKTFNSMFDGKPHDLFGQETDLLDPELEAFEIYTPDLQNLPQSLQFHQNA